STSTSTSTLPPRASDERRALYMNKWGRFAPSTLRHLSHAAPGIPARRRAWLLTLADRLETAGYSTFGDVPADSFDDIAELY
ncbi:hypothetical protein, partial [Conyzicola sp.]|uniref:hypothetical protein n=1 Tax=Conyzicola sp. TaxID=1969404 RepID=UPI003988E166